MGKMELLRATTFSDAHAVGRPTAQSKSAQRCFRRVRPVLLCMADLLLVAAAPDQPVEPLDSLLNQR